MREIIKGWFEQFVDSLSDNILIASFTIYFAMVK